MLRNTLLATALISLTVAGCSPVVATRGNLIEDKTLAQLEVDEMNRIDVLNLFGTPTSRATFDQDTWYYIGQTTEQTAFFEPEVTDRRILKLQFDREGVLRDVQELSLEDAQEIDTVSRETPTRGRQLGVLEQLLGNLGRFNPEQ
ncbi:MAG: outer membrane protein assembly factor BamE [Alphaproteobacteria bacterium]|nr:outer membrane protein assembly factor BamE [Alphaproteobacteria bacterium SS10]